jgi:hypothetical protein
MSIQVLIGIGIGLWLIALVACLLALRWSFTSVHKWFWICIALAVVSILTSWWGLARHHIVWSKTVNGERQWLVDSNWFFTLTLVLGVLALACTLWQRRKLNQVALAKG